MAKFSFKDSFTPEQEKALGKLKRMKVYKLISTNGSNEYKQIFDCIWWRVLHEVDITFEEEWTAGLTIQQAQTAKNWLREYQHLTNEFKNTSI